MEAAAAGAPSATGAQAAAQAAAQEAAQAAPAAAFAKRKNRGNLRKRAADSDEDGGGGGDDGGGAQRKAAKSKEGSMAFTTKRTDRAELFAFESSNAIQQERNDATRGNEQETAHDRDSRWVACRGCGAARRSAQAATAAAAQLCHVSLFG